MAPDRTPSSEGDARVGDFVAQRFGQVDGGEVSEQNFTGQLDGNDVDMRNVILTLPGNSARTVVVMAPRDSAGGPGAASSAAATGMLLQLVNQLRTQSHNKTLVFVSTDGSSAGAAGASEFAQNYSQQVKVVNGRAFYQNGMTWTDSTSQTQQNLRRQEVKFNSDEYFALIAKHPEAAEWLALGNEVDVVLGEELVMVR